MIHFSLLLNFYFQAFKWKSVLFCSWEFFVKIRFIVTPFYDLNLRYQYYYCLLKKGLINSFVIVTDFLFSGAFLVLDCCYALCDLNLSIRLLLIKERSFDIATEFLFSNGLLLSLLLNFYFQVHLNGSLFFLFLRIFCQNQTCYALCDENFSILLLLIKERSY